MSTTPNVNNVKMGACAVTWGGNSLGYTQGGVDVAIKTNTKAINVDQFGDSIVDEYVMGRTVQITVPMAESDLSKLTLAIPGSVLTIDGENPNKMMLVVSSNQGQSLRALANELNLHPIALAVTDLSGDFTVPIASPSGNMDFAYTYDKERIYKVMFTGYPDNVTGELFYFGDASANASDAVPLAISSGTYIAGDGTVTLVLSAAPSAGILGVGDEVTLSALTGTGAFATLDATYPILSVDGATVTVQGPAGLAATTITGGSLTV